MCVEERRDRQKSERERRGGRVGKSARFKPKQKRTDLPYTF